MGPLHLAGLRILVILVAHLIPKNREILYHLLFQDRHLLQAVLLGPGNLAALVSQTFQCLLLDLLVQLLHLLQDYLLVLDFL